MAGYHAASMLPEYLLYWGLERPPFALTPDPEMLYMSSQHRECLLRLKYAVMSGKGGALLVSENAGDGKTSVLRRLSLDLVDEFDGRCRTAFLSHPTLEPREMICEISRQLGGATPEGTKTDVLAALSDRLEELYRAGDKVVVIVDEGQMLAHRPDMLQELRVLLNFCVADAFLLTFIFSGQAPLEPAVRGMPEFWQRLPVRYFLRNLDLADTGELLHHRMDVAGADREIFLPEAAKLVHRYSEGCPRVICSIADLALVIGHSQRAREVGAEEVHLAANDMGLAEGVRQDGFHYFHFIRGESQGSEDAGDADRRARRRRLMEVGDVPEPSRAPAVPQRSAERAGAEQPSSPRAGDVELPEPERPEPEPSQPEIRQPEIPRCPSCDLPCQTTGSDAACMGCGRRLEIVCSGCMQPQPVGEAKCSVCGEELVPEEVALRRALAEGVREAGYRVTPADAVARLPRERGETIEVVLADPVRLRVEGASTVSRGILAVTSRGLSVLMRRSALKIPAEQVVLEAPGAPGVCLIRRRRPGNAEGQSYVLEVGTGEAGLVDSLQTWLGGRARLREVTAAPAGVGSSAEPRPSGRSSAPVAPRNGSGGGGSAPEVQS